MSNNSLSRSICYNYFIALISALYYSANTPHLPLEYYHCSTPISNFSNEYTSCSCMFQFLMKPALAYEETATVIDRLLNRSQLKHMCS